MVQIPDCVSYGNYTGSPMAGGSSAGTPAAAMPSGSVLRRDFGDDGILQAADDTDDSAADFDLSGPATENFAGDTVSNLSLGKIQLGHYLVWTNGSATMPSSFDILKTGDPMTVRGSAPFASIPGMSFLDPQPNQFPGLTCYVVRP